MFFELKSIKDKKVYIVEEHHKVIEAWADYRREATKAPFLVTLDHHTDTHSAFLRYSFNRETNQANNEMAENLVSLIDFKDSQSLINAIYKLRNDEHIDTAIKADIISKAFVIIAN